MHPMLALDFKSAHLRSRPSPSSVVPFTGASGISALNLKQNHSPSFHRRVMSDRSSHNALIFSFGQSLARFATRCPFATSLVSLSTRPDTTRLHSLGMKLPWKVNLASALFSATMPALDLLSTDVIFGCGLFARFFSAAFTLIDSTASTSQRPSTVKVLPRTQFLIPMSTASLIAYKRGSCGLDGLALQVWSCGSSKRMRR